MAFPPKKKPAKKGAVAAKKTAAKGKPFVPFGKTPMKGKKATPKKKG